MLSLVKEHMASVCMFPLLEYFLFFIPMAVVRSRQTVVVTWCVIPVTAELYLKR